MKDKNDWITQGIKNLANPKAVCMSSLRTAMIQKQKDILLNILKILRKLIQGAKKQHYSKI